jgi:hypothetical protein
MGNTEVALCLGDARVNIHDSLPMPFVPTHPLAPTLIACVSRDPLLRPSFEELAARLLPFALGTPSGSVSPRDGGSAAAGDGVDAGQTVVQNQLRLAPAPVANRPVTVFEQTIPTNKGETEMRVRAPTVILTSGDSSLPETEL